MIKALSFESYKRMVTHNTVFAKEDFNSFCKLNQNSIKAHICELLLNMPNIMLEIQWRYRTYADSKTLSEMNEIIGVLSSKVRNSEDSDAVWLAYRLIEEESKRLCVEHKLGEVLPSISLLVN